MDALGLQPQEGGLEQGLGTPGVGTATIAVFSDSKLHRYMIVATLTDEWLALTSCLSC